MKAEIEANESVSTAVIRAVSAVTGREPDSLPPLTEVIDPDALDALFDPQAEDLLEIGGRVSFSYSNCRITIDDGAFLTIEPVETTGRLSALSVGTDQVERSRSTSDAQPTATQTTPEARLCVACQQPIESGEQQRTLEELSRAELRCGISLETGSER